jgi:hypothetical protein
MVALSLVCICALAGCGGNAPALTPVTGTVTYNDKALAGATVRFIPNLQGDTKGHGGVGTTGEDGKFEVVSPRLDNRKGLLPGEYKVLIIRYVGVNGELLPPDVTTADTAAFHSIPEEFSKYQSTPLTATVETSAKSFEFTLKKN